MSAFSSYLSNHKEALLVSYARLLENFGQTLMTSTVVAISLALPLLLSIAISNLQALGESWDTEPKLTLYLNGRSREAAINTFLQELDDDSRIAKTTFISAEDALKEFEERSGFGEALAGLGHNPLPAAIELTPALGYRSAAQQKALAAALSAEPIVDEALVDLQWVQRFVAITKLASKMLWLLAVLLLIGALLVIGNTVRLIIENRKDEIIVIKMVGGTNAFVRRPLVYSGALYGVFGALLALLIVSVVMGVLSGTSNDIARAYSSAFELQGLSLSQFLSVLLVGLSLGYLGALFAVARHISQIEPS